jgi:hypothetical protein
MEKPDKKVVLGRKDEKQALPVQRPLGHREKTIGT